KIIIACEIFFIYSMLSICGKIICGRLVIKPIEWTYGDERCNFYWHFQVNRMSFYSPVIHIEAIKRANNKTISNKIICSDTNGNLITIIRQILRLQGTVSKINSLIFCGEKTGLIGWFCHQEN